MRARYAPRAGDAMPASPPPVTMPALLADAWWLLAGIADGEVDHAAVRVWLVRADALRRQLAEQVRA